MLLLSSAFSDQGIIPSIYTCEGEKINPPLEFMDVPSEAKSLTLIMDDPDVPKTLRADGMFDHWVVFNIPPTTCKIEQNKKPPGIEGKNTAGENRYYPPCPPDREHRYFFKLYALDKKLDLTHNATKKEVENAMQGHIIEQCVLIGLYEKGKGY
ncbi:MAG: YbhB/YbcL family Raf kinase inhibitor-like protein [Chlamydiae bacterium CG10_big_fil_rev_8_21_14_0_10_42_34]|nr:MAG: YbhB/YbcL family Raf kinase inhibitor-like protein [Chlamydiae bacterium CG10_big_fil_rev_8_21_14_0_10_42_34]